MCGRGRTWWRGVTPEVIVGPSGYTYIGPCRCGIGPHAYYRDSSGRIVHTWQAFRWGPALPTKPTEEDLNEEVKWLKEEKDGLEKRIQELEGQLKKEKK